VRSECLIEQSRWGSKRRYTKVIQMALAGAPVALRAPQASQVGNAVLIEQETVSLPRDHAFGFELADVGPAAIEVQR
jgi:hypothetical protein